MRLRLRHDVSSSTILSRLRVRSVEMVHQILVPAFAEILISDCSARMLPAYRVFTHPPPFLLFYKLPDRRCTVCSLAVSDNVSTRGTD